jgi:hypothetical protein
MFAAYKSGKCRLDTVPVTASPTPTPQLESTDSHQHNDTAGYKGSNYERRSSALSCQQVNQYTLGSRRDTWLCQRFQPVTDICSDSAVPERLKWEGVRGTRKKWNRDGVHGTRKVDKHCSTVKSKAVPLHAMEALGGERRYILDLGTRWG